MGLLKHFMQASNWQANQRQARCAQSRQRQTPVEVSDIRIEPGSSVIMFDRVKLGGTVAGYKPICTAFGHHQPIIPGRDALFINSFLIETFMTVKTSFDENDRQKGDL